jgi:alginate O-acetyltransferase complex protein AlgI
MLFNSAGFLFVYLPLTLAAFGLAVRLRSPAGAIAVLLAASYVFYGQWQLSLYLLLAASTTFNYVLGRAIAWTAQGHSPARARLLLCIGVAVDLAVLAWFKYAGFLLSSLDAVAGLQIPPPVVALPAGISFFTFTQIAFLADAMRGPVAVVRPADYFLFVSYFPHLIAGPIIHHRDTLPQFRRMARCGWDAAAAAMGISIFAIGLLKKVAIADNVAPFADSTFSRLAGGPLPALDSWIGALAYSFQIYFDFSGYSDMAVGLSLLFGVRLPLNFASPYKATSLIEFWSRWHMSLSQFLRDYVYIPLGGNRKGSARRYINLMATMLIGGLWHGAGWTFVVWGGLHGIYLVINHFVRSAVDGPARVLPPWLVWCKRIAVFVAVTVAWVFFRAASIADAGSMLSGMFGLHGPGSAGGTAGAVALLAACFVIVWALPSTYELFARHEPTLPARFATPPQESPWPAWRMNAFCATATGAVLALCVLAFYRPSPFIYFRF